MIHILQCLCGPKRHAIYAIMYDDKNEKPEEVRLGLEALIENWIETGQVRRRCEICDAAVVQFLYDDAISKEQDWDKALAITKRAEEEQGLTRMAVQAMRNAERARRRGENN
jgi:hypothetical protein